MSTIKIVINRCYGGFSISKKAWERYAELAGIDPEAPEHKWSAFRLSAVRDDPVLVQVVEELGPEANGSHSDLEVVEIPDDVEWQIEEYDGKEWVAEKHRTWP